MIIESKIIGCPTCGLACEEHTFDDGSFLIPCPKCDTNFPFGWYSLYIDMMEEILGINSDINIKVKKKGNFFHVKMNDNRKEMFAVIDKFEQIANKTCISCGVELDYLSIGLGMECIPECKL